MSTFGLPSISFFTDVLSIADGGSTTGQATTTIKTTAICMNEPVDNLPSSWSIWLTSFSTVGNFLEELSAARLASLALSKA